MKIFTFDFDRHWSCGFLAAKTVLAATALAFVLCQATTLAAPAAPADSAQLVKQDAVTATTAFQKWVDRYEQQPSAAQAVMQPEGRALAKQRRTALLQLAKVNPAGALALAAPASVRNQLPADLAAELETRVSGIGDLSVLVFCPAQGGGPVPPVQRWVELNGKTYQAFVYGRRAAQTTKQGIPLSGIVIDGVLVLDESPVRVLEADESQASARPAAGSAGLPPGTGLVVAEIGGQLYRFDSREHLQRAQAGLEAAESGLGPIPARNAAAILDEGAVLPPGGAGFEDPPTPWTTGQKRILVIRVDFSDLPGDPTYFGLVGTAPYVRGVADNEVAPFYATSSYGQTTLSNVVTTQIYRMPNTADSYAVAGNNTGLHSDARALAAADYNLADYDRICVLFTFLGNLPGSLINYGGLALLGGPYLWVNGEFDFRVYSHELGHTYGLFHAGLWQVFDGNPISLSGGVIEYGDEFDIMGDNFANDQRADFNPYYKNKLGWITDVQAPSVGTLPGTYRIYTFDSTNYLDAPGAPMLGLRIIKDNTKSYWVGLRHNFANNPFMENGVYVIWGYNSPGGGGGGSSSQSVLLDMLTPGINLQDSPLTIGRTFVDPDIGLTIRAIDPGGSSPNRYVDIEINGGTPLPKLVVAGSVISGGNGNGVIDANECNDLYLVLTNAGNAPATQVQATIATTTPGVTFGVRNSPYPDMVAGAGGTNVIAFRVSTAPFFVCGTPIDLSVLIKSDQVTSQTNQNLSTGSTAAPKQFDSTGPVVIRDADPIGTNSFINVSNLLSAVREVSVSLYLTHTFDSDLYFELSGPDGTTILLSDHNGGSGNNYGASCAPELFRTTFDDDAASSIVAGAPPFVGSFRPQQPLSVFVGKSGTNVNGLWKLHVVDDVGFDVGTVQCWSLHIATTTCTDGGGTCPGSDLALGLIDAPDPVFIGSNLVYTISVTNNGPGAATNVVVNQVLPPSVVFSSGGSTQGGVTHAGGTVVANLGVLPVSGVATVTVNVIPTLAVVISSTASVASSAVDPDTANNAAAVTTQVNPPASDLAVGLFDSPDPVLLGEMLTYNLSVTNNGPTTASGVTVTNTLPPGVLVQSTGSSQGFATINGNVVVFIFGTLTNAGRASGTINVIPTAEGTLVATAVARANQVDPLPVNNSVTATTTVGPAANLALTFTDAPDPVVVRSNWTYSITVTNQGPSAASSVVVNQTLPAGINVVSRSTTQGTTSVAGNALVANLGNLANGAGAVVTVTVNASNTGSYASTVTATAAQADPDPANNAASASTVVALPFVSIVTGGATLTGESVPADGAVSVGETVTVQLRLRNAGNVANTNLTATLLATGGVTSPSPAGPVTYGVLPPAGLPVGMPFTFTAGGTNGGTVTLTLQLQDGGNNLSNVTYSFTLPTVHAFANTNGIIIPDSGNASPYPSTIAVSGLEGLVGKVTATLSNLNHTFPQDVDMLLVAPNGQQTILMAAAGAAFLAAADVTFDDSAAFPVPQNGSILSGSYRPASYGAGSDLPSPAPVGPYPAAMSVFNGLNANGQWSLYVVDRSTGDAGNIAGGWSLGFTIISPVNQIVDLGVVAAVSSPPSFVAVNQSFVFTITNTGPNAATGVAFTNFVPASATLISAVASQGSITTNANSVAGSLGTINVGGSATVTIVVKPNTVGALALTGTASASETDLNPANNSGTATMTTSAQVADLVVNSVASTNKVVLGSNVTFTVSVTNAGPQQALGVTITDTFPTGLSFVSTSAAGSTNGSGALVVNLGDLASGAFSTFTVVANASGTGSLTNLVSGNTTSSDTNAANNAASIVIVSSAPAPIIAPISAVLSAESVLPPNATVDIGETVTVSLTLQNVGSANTANLVGTLLATGGVTDPSAAQNYGALTQGGAAVSRPYTFTASGVNGGVVVATLQLADGANNLGTATFTFSLPAVTSLTNAAAITIAAQGSASPYPSSIVVSGLTGLVTRVTATLNGLTHRFPDDVDIELISPTGQKVMLMSDAGGGNAITNRTLTFDDAGAVLPDSSTIFSGTFMPADYEPGDVFPPPAPSGTVAVSLAAFNGAAANGTWSLYVADDSTGDGGSIAGGWTLTLTTVNAVNPLTDLAVSMTATPASLYVGSGLTYNLGVVNNGPVVATEVTITDALPAGLSFVSGTSSQGSLNNVGGVVTINFGSLPVAGSATATIRVTPAFGGSVSNAVVVAGGESDANLVNNAAHVITTVLIPVRASLTDVTVTNAQLQFTLTGDAGMAYVIQASTNLTTWTSLATNTAPPSGIIKFTDTSSPGFSSRFYRALRVIP